MRAVRLGKGVQGIEFDDGRQIDFGGEGAFRIDWAGRISSDVYGRLLEVETTPLLQLRRGGQCPSERRRVIDKIATVAQKIWKSAAASYL